MPTSTVEDYLKCILLREQEGSATRVSTGQIAQDLAVAPATVTSMLKTLSGSGLVSYEPYSGVSLTAAGQQLAMHVLRRHRLVELFLERIMGMDWSEVHAEAELLEHTVSDRLIERMDEMLDYPQVDPHGDPIPTSSGVVETPESLSLLHCALHTSLLVARISDQRAEFLQLVEREGLRPGSELIVRERDSSAERVVLERPGRDPLHLGFGAASKIQVRAAE